jgi:F0F1-type ATP synthase assembly protein I
MNTTSGGNSKPVSENNLDGSDADRIEAQANTNAASRAIAVMILMVIPGVAGSYLDKWLGTQFFVLIGFVLGIGIAIFGLLYVARIADLAAKRSRELRRSIDGGKSASNGHE